MIFLWCLDGLAVEYQGGGTDIERHPGYGLIMIDLVTLRQGQFEGFVVEFEGEDSSWRSPCADKKMMLHLDLGNYN
jgi:hypothetical protein